MLRRTLSLLLIATALPLLSQETKPKAKKKKAAPTPVATPAPVPAAPAPTPAPKPKPRVRFDTSYGAVVVELEPELAPRTVENFLRYVKDGHYAGTLFHRVIPGFMIQGGGHVEDMSEKPTREAIPNEAPSTFKAGLKNTRGTLAMARLPQPHSATAQFYINTADNSQLDHQNTSDQGFGYCAFGRVVEGMEVVDKIERVRTVWRRGLQDVPEYPVRIKSAEQLPPGR